MSPDFLAQIIATKRARLAAQDVDLRCLRTRAEQAIATKPKHRLRAALQRRDRINIIAEFKRRSPSAGAIRADVDPAIVRKYERGGACAISVLTDEDYFGGSIVDLAKARAATSLPILRKDFIVDPAQIYEAAAAGADAVLLIAAALDDDLLRELRAIAEEQLGLDALIEMHTAVELERALAAGARLIGVNNRNLRTLEVSLATSEELIKRIPPDVVAVSESGLRDAATLRHLRSIGFSGFLIGEALMRACDPAAALRELVDASTTRGSTIVNRVRTKICGITSVRDAVACAEAGADMIGLNFYAGSRRCIDSAVARNIVDALPATIEAVAVFVEPPIDEVRDLANRVGFKSVQLHGNVSGEICAELAREFRVIRALSTDANFRPEDLCELRHCDVLLDAPHAELRGGTGTMCDWTIARAAVPLARTLILSGGLNARNVRAAIATVQPHAVDACSGVESAPGIKDHSAVREFIAAAHSIAA